MTHIKHKNLRIKRTKKKRTNYGPEYFSVIVFYVNLNFNSLLCRCNCQFLVNIDTVEPITEGAGTSEGAGVTGNNCVT